MIKTNYDTTHKKGMLYTLNKVSNPQDSIDIGC